MMWMFTAHIITWWIVPEDKWIYYIIYPIIDFIGASGFLFISGISTALSYNNRKIKAQNDDNYNEKMIRNEYFIRVLLLFILALLFNIAFGWIWYRKIINLWRWYFLLTLSFSLLFAWPLLKASKIFRICIGACICIGNKILIDVLLPYEGEFNLYGILFYILYYKVYTDNPILTFFIFFLIGTVFGDIFFEMNQIENRNERLTILKKKIIIPSSILAPILITIGVIFEFPKFFTLRGSLSWSIYCLGLIMVLITIFISIENYMTIKTEKSYKFLFYFSYYSLSLFMFHFPLALLFYGKISLSYIIFYIVGTIIIVGVFLRFLYKKIEDKYTIFNWKITFSLNTIISRISTNIVRKKKKLS